MLIPDDLAPEMCESCVLLVDDEASIRQLLSRLLEGDGYKVINAENGIEAIVKLRGTLPRLIISELEMPRMSGFELIGVIRRRFPAIPIIVFTASVLREFPTEIKPDLLLEKNAHRLADLVQVVNDLARNPPLRIERLGVTTPARIRPGSGGDFVLTCQECLRTFEATTTPRKEAIEGKAVCTHYEARVPYLMESSEPE